jgi:hypothetical protein
MCPPLFTRSLLAACLHRHWHDAHGLGCGPPPATRHPPPAMPRGGMLVATKSGGVAGCGGPAHARGSSPAKSRPRQYNFTGCG